MLLELLKTRPNFFSSASINSSVELYADDTTMVSSSGNSIRIPEVEEKLSVGCNQLSDWMRENKLKINPDKTRINTMGTQQRLQRNGALNVNVQMDGVSLPSNPSKCEGSFLLNRKNITTINIR